MTAIPLDPSIPTTLAYVAPIMNAGYGPPVIRPVPSELVEDAPSIWYVPQTDGTLSTYLVTEKGPRDPNEPTQVELWQYSARQGHAINDIDERRVEPEAVDNQAFNRTGYSMDIIGYVATPTDGSSFDQSIDYFRSYSPDDW